MHHRKNTKNNHQNVISFFISISCFCFLFFTNNACVSVDIKQKPGKKSDQFQMKEPALPFQTMKTDYVDYAWKDFATDSMISVYSECKENQSTNLQQIEREAMQSLSHSQIISSETIAYNERGSLLTIASGDIDGVPMKVKMLTISKNFCNYTLMYSSKEERFDKLIKYFDKFILDFHIL